MELQCVHFLLLASLQCEKPPKWNFHHLTNNNDYNDLRSLALASTSTDRLSIFSELKLKDANWSWKTRLSAVLKDATIGGITVVLVSDGVATATVNGNKMAKCLSGACCVVNSTAAEICLLILDDHPELVEKPQAPLRGDARFLAEKQSRYQ